MLQPLAYERPIIRDSPYGWINLNWRRQAHKTTTLAKKALKVMMKQPNRLVTYCSASLLVGREMILREGQIVESAREKLLKDAQVFRDNLADWKKEVDQSKLKLETSGDGLNLDDFADLFEKQRLEFRVWHSQTTYSRTLLVAPNPATAVGYSGYVFIDETGRIDDLKDLLEAMEPILSSNPDFRLLTAGTPPPDDAHYYYELSVPPEGTTFTPCAEGHWYESQAGIMTHRVDAYDAELAGLKSYSLKTREEITPAQHRAEALDRDAWDRNYGLIFKVGGIAALSLQVIAHAMAAGRGRCLFAEDELPANWMRFLVPDVRAAIGYDIATTEKKMSNPGAISVGQLIQGVFVEAFAFVWKTNDPEVARMVLRSVFNGVRERTGKPPKRLCIDATNERFFARDVKTEFAGQMIVELVVMSENTEYLGQTMSWKSYLGNQLVNHYEDGQIAMAGDRYLREDARLVTKERGLFVNNVDSQGRHGDTFDARKLALHGLVTKGGPVEAEAVNVGGIGPKPNTARWKNPFARLTEGGVKTHV
jgi:hypothetical protein